MECRDAPAERLEQPGGAVASRGARHRHDILNCRRAVHDLAGAGKWHPRMPEHLDDDELADWRAGRNAVYQLAALTIDWRGTRP